MKKMKFLVTAMVAVGMSYVSFAQSWSLTGNAGTTPGTNYVGTTDAQDLVLKTNGTERMRILSTGLVSVEAPASFSNPGGTFPSTILNIKGTSQTSSLTMGTYIHRSWIRAYGTGANDEVLALSCKKVEIGFNAHLFNQSTQANYDFCLFTYKGIQIGNSNSTGNMLNIPSGFAVIGNVTTNSNYKLFVETGIRTEKVKVAVKGTPNWADYVFNKDYKLLSLGEVETYIQKNKHLPGVPSAEEVVKEGIDMATMDAKLLEKIEELTLYMIELKKENEMLKKHNEVIIQRLNLLEK